MNWRRHLPHRTKSGLSICLPFACAFLVGGTYEDRHGGYGWRPSLLRMAQRYYREGWRGAGYTLLCWLGLTRDRRFRREPVPMVTNSGRLP